jgi:hypothetical protein
MSEVQLPLLNHNEHSQGRRPHEKRAYPAVPRKPIIPAAVHSKVHPLFGEARKNIVGRIQQDNGEASLAKNPLKRPREHWHQQRFCFGIASLNWTSRGLPWTYENKAASHTSISDAHQLRICNSGAGSSQWDSTSDS